MKKVIHKIIELFLAMNIEKKYNWSIPENGPIQIPSDKKGSYEKTFI